MSTAEQGLSSAEAARRLAQYGPNEPAPVRRLSAVVQLLHLFANPLVIILLVASAIAACSGTASRRADHRDDGGARRRDQLLAVVPVATGGGATPRVGDPRRPRCSATGPGRRRRCGTWCRATSSGCRPAIWCRPTHGCRVARSLCSAIDADGRVAAGRQDCGRRAEARSDRARTRPIWCFSAPRSSAAPARRWPSPPGPRRCSAISPSGYGAARQKPSSNTACAGSAC